jgi:hypothetical protein
MFVILLYKFGGISIMKKIRSIAAFIVFSLLFVNCQNKNYDTFFEKEKLRLIDATQEIIEKLGLENYEILAYAHKSISNKIISKNINDTKYSGDYFEPDNPVDYDEEKDGKVFADIHNTYNWVQQRTITANYEPKLGNEIMYDNISIIIIFDAISNLKKQELLKILNSYILNIERGDNIYIISKLEFDKLE